MVSDKVRLDFLKANVVFKLAAGKFALQQLKKIWGHKTTLETLNFNILLDVFVFELYGAFEAQLQYINQKENLNIDSWEIEWGLKNSRFKKALKSHNKQGFDKIEALNNQDWFVFLRDFRNTVSHSKFQHRDMLVRPSGRVAAFKIIIEATDRKIETRTLLIQTNNNHTIFDDWLLQMQNSIKGLL